MKEISLSTPIICYIFPGRLNVEQEIKDLKGGVLVQEALTKNNPNSFLVIHLELRSEIHRRLGEGGVNTGGASASNKPLQQIYTRLRVLSP